MICESSKEIVIVFKVLIIFSIWVSIYTAYKIKNNYLGLGIFVCLMLGISGGVYVVFQQLKSDFQQPVCIILTQKPQKSQINQELETVRQWVDFHRMENQKKPKAPTAFEKRKFILYEEESEQG